jgi:hypothetical protein
VWLEPIGDTSQEAVPTVRGDVAGLGEEDFELRVGEGDSLRSWSAPIHRCPHHRAVTEDEQTRRGGPRAPRQRTSRKRNAWPETRHCLPIGREINGREARLAGLLGPPGGMKSGHTASRM